MFDHMIQAALSPLRDRIAELEEQTESGRRQSRNGINMGHVAALVDGQRIIVSLDTNTKTPPIRWAALACGITSSYRAPSVGEIALVLNWGNGDSHASSIALVGIPSADHPLPASDPNKVVDKIGDKGWMEWDVETGELLVRAKKVTFDSEEMHCTGEISDKVRKISDDRKIYDGHDHDETQSVTRTPNQKQGAG